MGGCASTASDTGPTAGHKHRRKATGTTDATDNGSIATRHSGKRGDRGATPSLQLTSISPLVQPPEPQPQEQSTGSTAQPKAPACEDRGSDGGSDLSSISEDDPYARSQELFAPPPMFGNVKGLDKQREEAAVDLADEFFVWDDAAVDVAELRGAKAAMRKSVVNRNKPMLNHTAQRTPAKPGTAGAFVFNDFTIATIDEMDAFAAPVAARRPGTAGGRASQAGHLAAAAAAAVAAANAAEPPRRERIKPLVPRGQLQSYGLSTLVGHSSRVKCLAVAPGEREYVSCSNEDSIVTYYDMRTGQELGIYSGHQDTVIFATFSPCGKFLATTSRDNTLMLWDVVTQKAILTFEHAKVVICCCFSRDSKFIATGCQDKVCRLWETRKGKELLAFTQHEGIIISLCFSPDESHIVSASADKTLRMWTTLKGKCKAVMRGHTAIILSCQYSADGKKVVSNDERLVKVWSAADGSCTMTLNVDDFVKLRNLPPQKKLSWTLSCTAPSRYSDYFIVACNNRFVYMININTGAEEISVDTKAPVYCLTCGPQNVVAFGDSFGNVYCLTLRGYQDDAPGGPVEFPASGPPIIS